MLHSPKIDNIGLSDFLIRLDRTVIDQLRAIAIFHEVVESGSFRGAAKTLKLSPSVVSHHVSQLEQRLGTALLYRSTRKVSLTEDGTVLFEAGQKIMAAAKSGIGTIQHQTDLPSGRLRIALPGNLFERPPFSDHLAAFAKQYPDVTLSLSFSDQRVELIGSDFDVALRTGWLENSQYKARKLADLEHALVASKDYLAGKPLPKTINDLSEMDWIKFRQFPVNKQLTNTKGEMPRINPDTSIEVDGVVALCQMAKSGLGIAAVPKVIAQDALDSGKLIALNPNWSLKPISLYAVWPNNVSEESLTLRFVRFMADRMVSEKG